MFFFVESIENACKHKKYIDLWNIDLYLLCILFFIFLTQNQVYSYSRLVLGKSMHDKWIYKYRTDATVKFMKRISREFHQILRIGFYVNRWPLSQRLWNTQQFTAKTINSNINIGFLINTMQFKREISAFSFQFINGHLKNLVYCFDFRRFDSLYFLFYLLLFVQPNEWVKNFTLVGNYVSRRNCQWETKLTFHFPHYFISYMSNKQHTQSTLSLTHNQCSSHACYSCDVDIDAHFSASMTHFEENRK